jgi:hypothetical protein
MAQLFDIDDGMREATAQAQRQAARLDMASVAPVAAADPTGAVTVTVRADGAVVGVRLQDNWRKRIGGDLAGAVVAAISAAQRDATQAWLDGVNAETETPPPPAAALPGTPARFAGADPAAFARELQGLLAEVEAQLGDLPSRAREAAQQTVEVRGPAGGITAVAQEGALVRLDCDERWLAEAPRSRVEAELDTVLTRALPGVQQQVTGALRAGPVGELLDLAGDPATLFAHLGLTR